eukprot:scaffold146220_cov33-Cyclotella_meneghiniana.AAC.1
MSNSRNSTQSPPSKNAAIYGRVPQSGKEAPVPHYFAKRRHWPDGSTTAAGVYEPAHGCFFAAGHVPGNQLPDAFVEDAIGRLKSGVEGIVASLSEGKPKVGDKRPFGNNSSGGSQGGYYGPAGDRGTKRR